MDKHFGSPLVLRALPYLLGLAALLGGILVVVSHFASDWWQDFWMNVGFLFGTVAFAIFIVERLVSIHEEARWSGPREVAWLQLRVIATGMIQSLAQYYPDPELTLNSPSFLDRAQMYQDLDAPYRSLYSNAEWVKHIQTDVIPAYHVSFPELAIYQLEETIQILLRTENDLTECLSLFSQLLDAITIEQMLKLSNLIRREGPYVHVVLSEKRSGGGMSSNPRPALSPLLETAIRIVIAVSHRYPTSTAPASSSLPNSA